MKNSISPLALRVLKMRWDGKCLKEIGRELNRSPRTAEYHWQNVCTSLGARDPVAVIRVALKRGLISLPLLLCALCIGAAVRSPKDASSQSGKLMVRAPSSHEAVPLLPLTATPAIVIRPPKPYHITLAWDSTTLTNKIYVATNNPPLIWPPGPGEGYTRTVTVQGNFGTVSNLWPNTGYRLTCTAVDTTGIESDFAVPIYWPRWRTNYVALGVSASPSNGSWTVTQTVTNPTGYYRLHRLTNAFSLQNAPTVFGPWAVLSNWPAVNPASLFWLRYSNYDNVSGLWHQD